MSVWERLCESAIGFVKRPAPKGKRNCMRGVGDRLYEEVIDRFIRSPVTEPLTVLTHCMARHVFHPVDPPVEPNTPIWPSLVNRPGLDSHTGLCERPAGTHHRTDCLVPSTLQGLNAPRLVCERCDKRTPPSCHAACASDADRSTSAILPRCMLERSNQTTSACHEPHSCLRHFSSCP